MIIYKDITTGDELFSDVYPIEEYMSCFYKVQGKTITVNSEGIDDSLIGGNASAEEPVESADDCGSKSAVNIVHAHKLASAPTYTKKSLQTYLKTYCKRVVSCLEEEGDKTKEIEGFKGSAKEGLKYLIDNLKDLEYFTGESMDPDGAMGFLNYEADGITPYLLFFKYGVKAEKF